MSLFVVHPGTCATVQDRGRPGFRSVGVPTGGSFDGSALMLANALVANPESAAALELTGLGGTYEAGVPLYLALAGAPVRAEIQAGDGRVIPLSPPCSFPMAAGDRLIVGGARRGARAVLAVRGGIATPVVLGSRSSETPVRAGDRLPAAPGWGPFRRLAADGWEPNAGDDAPVVLHVLDGPDAGAAAWEGLVWTVGSACDRMGVRLEGPAVPPPGGGAAAVERLSAPVAPGAVQWTAGGLIVLGVAGGTMGGYPHGAQLGTPDLDRLAQLRPGDRVGFRRIGLAEARDRDARYRRWLHATRLRVATLAGAGLDDRAAGPGGGGTELAGSPTIG